MMILLTVSAFSATEFTVMAVNGSVQYKSQSGSWSAVKTGTKLSPTDAIKVTSGGYVSMLHSSGKTLELKSPGEFKASQLTGQLSSKKSSVAQKLSTYVLDKLGEGSKDKYNYREGMETTGAVERSIGTAIIDGKTMFVELKSPRKVNFKGNETELTWKSVNSNDSYFLTITDRFDRVVFTKEVAGNTCKINSGEIKLEQDVYYFWNVALKSDRSVKSPDCAFQFLSSNKIGQIDREFAELKEELGGDNSAINQLILANFYEQNLLMDEALRYYKKAVETEPSVEEYQNIYKGFLLRVNSNN
jgi:hypothetical protein